MSLAVVVGVGIVALFFLLFAKIINKEKHEHLYNFLIILVFPFLFLIPATLVIDQTVCEPVVANETVSGNITVYDYTEHCFEKSNGSRAFFTSYAIVIGVFMIYVFLMFGADIIKAFEKLVKK